ncbi:unnamed protein product [Mytilus coruscus]|uniref:Uncharacterized protein n=1 Tax=Mytilus coruscus TaxID=42192 RepID=A0A6J8D3K1_MYTCO|nr:unnamed protein product [Mytilus coruscus]
MKEDIQIWISQCDIRGANKPPQKLSRVPLGKVPVGGPLDRLATDLLGPLPLTPRNYRTLVSMIKSYLRGEQTNGDPNHGCLASAYRDCPNHTTSLTPHVIKLGREIRFPFELTREETEFVPETEEATWGAHALKVGERLQKAHHVARNHLDVNLRKRKITTMSKPTFSNTKSLTKCGTYMKLGEKAVVLNNNRCIWVYV